MVELVARAVSYAYPGGRQALAEVSFALAPGELVCLLGPNGSGKSTLLRCCAGLFRPTSGALTLDGERLDLLAPRERACRIAFVPQGLQVPPDLDARAFVLGGRYAHHPRWAGLLARATPTDRNAVERALEEADAADLASRRLDELSAGQLQRVRVARALAQESPLLLFDEPTAALDPEHQVRLFLLVERLVAAGRTAIVATHELGLASRFARRALLLDAGRVVADGSAEEVLRPAVLEPVFGPHLHYGRVVVPGLGERAVVVPWPREDAAREGSEGADRSRKPS